MENMMEDGNVKLVVCTKTANMNAVGSKQNTNIVV